MQPGDWTSDVLGLTTLAISFREETPPVSQQAGSKPGNPVKIIQIPRSGGGNSATRLWLALPENSPDNGVDVTAQHLGTTVVVVGARPQRPSPEAKVTRAGAAEEEDPAG